MLTDNQYGFDLQKNNPFVIFRYLAKKAIDSVGVDKVLDLSRGDPGYGFAPNVRSRRLYSFLVNLDTTFNNFETHFKDYSKSNETDILQIADKFAQENYSPEVAIELMKDFSEFTSLVIEAAERQGLQWTHFDVLFQLFKYSTVSGGCYHDPYGELLARIVVADYHSQKLKLDIKYSDLVFTAGASHAIGTFFEAFGEESRPQSSELERDKGGALLKKGDTAMITSPVYFPYMGIMEARELDVVTISVDPENGQFTPDAFEKVTDANPKVIFLVDPDNPTGFTKSEESLKRLAEYAEEKDAIIVTDEVYHSFHPGKKSILEFAPKRTIRIDARSKIERATGCRFGEYIVTEEVNKYLSKKLQKHFPEGVSDLRTYLHDAKAPGGVLGEFRHTTFVGGPGQLLSICHIILGEAERRKYTELVQQNMQTWYDGLGLEYKGNFYYSMFDMNVIANETKKKISAEQKLLDLAERGVVLIPANLFFAEADRKDIDRSNYVRASLPNLTNEQVGEAAGVIKAYLAG